MSDTNLYFLEVFKDLDPAVTLPDGVHGGVSRPDELLSCPKTLVSPRQRRVDDVLAVSTDHYKSGKISRDAIAWWRYDK